MKNALALFLISTMWSGLGFSQTDQELTYSTLLGGNLFDAGSKLQYNEASGIIGFTASTNSFNFPLEGDSYQTFSLGEQDVVYGQMDENGNLIYSTYLGGDDVDFCNGLGIQNNGDVVLGGITSSSDFPIQDAHLSVFSGSQKGWLTKFNSEHELVWSTFIGGNGEVDGISGLVVNSDGDIFIIGVTQSTNLGTPGVYQENMLDFSSSAGFIAKYDLNGFPVWYSYISDNDLPSLSEMTLSADEESVYIVGNTAGDLEFDGNSHQLENNGLRDAILLSLNAENGTLNWGTYYGGSEIENGIDVETAENGTVILSGYTNSIGNIATPGALNENLNDGAVDAFLAAFDQNGQRLWGTYLGSTTFDLFDNFLDIKGEYIYFSATTGSENLTIIGEDPLVPIVENLSIGENVGYIAKINLDGSFVWSTYSNPDYDCANCYIIEATENGTFYCLGIFPDESNNPECLGTIPTDAYQTEYGGGFTDMAFFIYQDNTLSTTFPKAEPLKIYPNPAQDFITIEAPDLLWAGMELTVTDLSGRTVDRVARFQSGNAYSTSHLADGVYILTGQIGERMFRQKMVITR